MVLVGRLAVGKDRIFPAALIKYLAVKVLVLSDIHDHLTPLQKLIAEAHGKTEAVVFLGDLVSPFTASILAKLNLPIQAILGNNDEDQIGIFKKSGDKFTWWHLSQEFGFAEMGNRKIAFCHYPKLAQLLAKAGEYDAVFYGHTHRVQNELIGKTLLLNPGAVCGLDFNKAAYVKSTYAIYDTETNGAEIVSR